MNAYIKKYFNVLIPKEFKCRNDNNERINIMLKNQSLPEINILIQNKDSGIVESCIPFRNVHRAEIINGSF